MNPTDVLPYFVTNLKLKWKNLDDIILKVRILIGLYVIDVRVSKFKVKSRCCFFPAVGRYCINSIPHEHKLETK